MTITGTAGSDTNRTVFIFLNASNDTGLSLNKLNWLIMAGSDMTGSHKIHSHVNGTLLINSGLVTDISGCILFPTLLNPVINEQVSVGKTVVFILTFHRSRCGTNIQSVPCDVDVAM